MFPVPVQEEEQCEHVQITLFLCNHVASPSHTLQSQDPLRCCSVLHCDQLQSDLLVPPNITQHNNEYSQLLAKRAVLCTTESILYDFRPGNLSR